MQSDSSTHTFEPELLKSTPRAVVRRANSAKNFRGCIGCFLIPHTLVGIGVIVWLLWTVLIAVAGQNVSATITGRSTSSSDDGPRYFLHYSYDAGGQKYRSKASVTSAAYDSTVDGALVAARVFPLLPAIGSQLLMAGNNSLPSFIFIVGFAVFWNGIVYLAWRAAVFGARGGKNLVKNGVPTVGRILYKRVVTGSYGDSHYVVYEWIAPAGTTRRNSISPFASSALPPHLSDAFAIAPTAIAPTMRADFKPFPDEPAHEAQDATVFLKEENKIGALRQVIAEVKAKLKHDKARIEARKTPGALSREETVELKEWNAVRVGEIVSVLVDSRNASKSVVYKICGWQAQ